MQKYNLVVFDFDGTIIHGDISRFLVILLCFRNPLFSLKLLKRVMNITTHCEFNEKIYEEYTSISNTNRIYSLLLSYSRKKLNHEIFASLCEYRIKPFHIVRIVSGSINPVIKRLSIDLCGVEGTGSFPQSNKFNCLKENKALFLRTNHAFRELSFYHFFSDSIGECNEMEFFYKITFVKKKDISSELFGGF